MNDVKPNALASLIDETRGRNRWSDMDVVRQAQERRPELRLTKQDISHWRTEGMQHLNPRKIVALAAGLRVPVYRVALAVLADQGIDVPVDVRTPEDAIHQDHTLTAHTRDVVLLLIAQDRQAQAPTVRAESEKDGPHTAGQTTH